MRTSDDGKGIEQEELERVFDRFHRGAVSRRGLTIARGIARANGGDISLASPGLGAGSRFTVVVPRRVAALGRTVGETTSPVSLAGSGNEKVPLGTDLR